jgi:hypothetical protein
MNLSTSSPKSFFILLFSTSSGYRQSHLFHLAEPVDFDRYDTKTKHALILHAFKSLGVAFSTVSPDHPILIKSFSTEAECRNEYERVRGDRQGPAPLAGWN